jgi:hypothetical protein
MSRLYPCPHHGCGKVLKNKSSLTQHHHSKHGFLVPPKRQPPIPVLHPLPPSPVPYDDTAGTNEETVEAASEGVDVPESELIVDYHTELDS